MDNHWFKEHKISAFLVYVLFLSIFILGGLEVFLRFYINYNPSYYTGFKSPGKGEKHFPYGTIKINSDGFYDDEFLPTKQKPRIGYFGDSVLFGVGVGHGYRITELLEKTLPQYEHMNFASVGAGIDRSTTRRVLETAKKYDIDKVVYLMNLNDIDPDTTVTEGEPSTSSLNQVKGFHLRKLEKILRLRRLRSKSYLYTVLRSIIKKQLIRHGYDVHGYLAYELFPEKYEKVIRDFARRVTSLAERLKADSREFLVIILPYEMQISEAAEMKYRDFGVKWEESFIDRGTQRIIIDELNEQGVVFLDSYYGFVDPEQPGDLRLRNGLGEFFVYNRGDKLDWNHPNREGHRKIADYILKNKELFLRQISN